MEMGIAHGEGGVIQCGADLFHNVPKECIASMIASTTPTDACRFALVSKDFLAASESNDVWDLFLPSDLDLIVARSDGGEALLTEFRDKKKQLYLLLSDRPLLVDRASKSFWLDKSSGKKCWMMSARSMTIIWSEFPKNWKWTSIPESRFPKVAELLLMSWLDIYGRIQSSRLSPGTQYAAYLVYKISKGAYGLDRAFNASVYIADVEVQSRPVYIGDYYEELEAQGEASSMSSRDFRLQRSLPQGATADQFPTLRADRWRELKIGEFFTHPGEGDEVELAVREVLNLNYKRGLVIQGIEVRLAFERVLDCCLSKM